MRENELALLIGKGIYFVKAGDRKINTEFGIVDQSELLKKKFGDKIKTHSGEEFTIVKPNLIDILMKKMKRLPQIIMPKDASLILGYTGVSTDSFIVDAGTGSGFLSIFLGYYCNKGKVVTYEKRSEFAKVARDNIDTIGLKNVIVKERDILNGIEEKNVDLITLDIEFPEQVVGICFNSLKKGGWLVIYSPHIEQVIRTRKEVEKLSFSQVKTIENITREWRVGKHTLPEVSGVIHTGWLTFARNF